SLHDALPISCCSRHCFAFHCDGRLLVGGGTTGSNGMVLRDQRHATWCLVLGINNCYVAEDSSRGSPFGRNEDLSLVDYISLGVIRCVGIRSVPVLKELRRDVSCNDASDSSRTAAISRAFKC